MTPMIPEDAAAVIADVLGVDLEEVNVDADAAQYDPGSGDPGVGASVTLLVCGDPTVSAVYGAATVTIEDSRDVRADLERAVAAVRRLDRADSDAAHAALLDVVGGLVADSPHGGGIAGLARIAAAEVERLRARVADLEREREDLVHVSAADLAAKLAVLGDLGMNEVVR